jgi:hypothetical protein
MSRSYKKYPIAGIIAAESEKKDKRIANRVYRAYIRRALHQDKDITKGLLDSSAGIPTPYRLQIGVG